MSKYASNRNAYGISDRSGFRYRLRNMRMEWNGLLVGKDEWEPKHPQLEPQRNIQYGFNPVGMRNDFNLTPNNLVSTGSVGSVTVVTT